MSVKNFKIDPAALERVVRTAVDEEFSLIKVAKRRVSEKAAMTIECPVHHQYASIIDLFDDPNVPFGFTDICCDELKGLLLQAIGATENQE